MINKEQDNNHAKSIYELLQKFVINVVCQGIANELLEVLLTLTQSSQLTEPENQEFWVIKVIWIYRDDIGDEMAIEIVASDVFGCIQDLDIFHLNLKEVQDYVHTLDYQHDKINLAVVQ